MVRGILRHTSMYIFFYKPFHATSYIYTHIFWKASFATYSQIHIFWKTLLRYPSKHFVRHFMLYIFILCKEFSCYIYSYFARHFHATYLHTYILSKGFFMLSKRKAFLMGQQALNSSQKTPQTYSNTHAPFTFKTGNLDS